MKSAFGVEHISKGAILASKEEKLKRLQEQPSESKTKKQKEWRESKLAGVNPRSNTYVKEGTLPQRVAKPVGAGYIAGPAGTSWGRTSNLREDDTRSYRKKDGAKATSYVGYGDVGMYRHANEAKLKRKIKEKKIALSD